MSKKMPLDVKKLLESVASIGSDRKLPVAVDLVIDPTASDKLVAAALDAFIDVETDASVEAIVMDGSIPDIPVPADLCVIVGGTSALLGDIASAARAKGVPCAVLVARGETFFASTRREAIQVQPPASSANASAASSASAAATAAFGTAASDGGSATACKGIPLSDIVDVDVDAARPLEELADWIVVNAPAKRLAMAECFPFMRRALALELGRSNAVQNGAIGLVFFIPGADMPLITLNQAKMVLQIAAIYGRKLDSERAREVIAVVVGGFGFRAIARRLAACVPVLGWAIKPAVAASGTVAMSYAAVEYFEPEGVVRGAVDAVEPAVSRAADAVASVAAGFKPETAQ